MAHSATFATAINCMDGRTQEPIINYMKNKFKVDYVDMISEPGPVKALAENKSINPNQKIQDIQEMFSRISEASAQSIENTLSAITFAEAGDQETARSLIEMTAAASIRKRVNISVEVHGSKTIAIVAHHDCAGNPVDKTIQLRQLDEAAATIDSWGYNTKVVKLWVDPSWQVFEIN